MSPKRAAVQRQPDRQIAGRRGIDDHVDEREEGDEEAAAVDPPELHAEAEVGLVVPVLRHRLVERHAQEVLVGFAKECQVTRFTFKGNWSKPVKPKKWVSDMMRARPKYYRQALAELGYINGVDPAMAEIAITELHRAAERLSRIVTIRQDVDKSVVDLLSPR